MDSEGHRPDRQVAPAQVSAIPGFQRSHYCPHTWAKSPKPKSHITSQFIGIKASLKNIYYTDLHITVVPVENGFSNKNLQFIGFHKERPKCWLRTQLSNKLSKHKPSLHRCHFLFHITYSILPAKAFMGHIMDWKEEQI